jgi:hypothetical protein
MRLGIFPKVNLFYYKMVDLKNSYRIISKINKNFSKKMSQERTFIMIKPDGVQRGFVSEIIKRIEQKGYQLIGLKMMNVYLTISFI